MFRILTLIILLYFPLKPSVIAGKRQCYGTRLRSTTSVLHSSLNHANYIMIFKQKQIQYQLGKLLN